MLSRTELEYHSLAVFTKAIHRGLLVVLQSLETSFTLMPKIRTNIEAYIFL
jgi:hypothetical protein